MPKYNNEITDTSRRGLWVIVRCFGDEARRVRIWEENENAVWVISDERYRKKVEDEGLVPGPYVGFQWGNVFVDDPEWLDNWDPSFEGFWEGLTPLARVPSIPHPQERTH
jgi:hypothetical protein